MHQVDERVALSDLETLKRITVRLMQAYFASNDLKPTRA
jgi:acetylornithine deacetylase/succinyl-diaminopimelate desuccinylase-like protein